MYSIDEPITKYQFGIAFGVGVRYKINMGSYFFIKTDFEYRKPSSHNGGLLTDSNTKSLVATMGYGFNLKK